MQHHPSHWQTQAIQWIADLNALGHTPTATEVAEAAGGTPQDHAERRRRHRSITTLVGERIIDQRNTPDGYVLVAKHPPRRNRRERINA